MLTLTSWRWPLRWSTMRSSTGATAWHGPHHSAQKSTSTGVSLWSTSCSKLCSVTAVDTGPFLTDGSVVPLWKRFGTSECSSPRIEAVFETLAQYPDHLALEGEILAWWETEGIFDRLREQNRGGPRFSFMDGPITANNPMGAHHCWGRTLKDVFQRYKALQGHELRYQNGFDCQGLWVEVGAERELGLNSKREIEEYGLAEFAERCKERVAKYAEVITDQCRRLGMWMDWDNDYYTFSDTNIEYIWRFLRECHERDWLYLGHRAVEWCPRCGTSLSQHELINSYAELTHPSLYVRFPLKGRAGESLVVWTTTPWTLPANVAAAVNPDAEYGLTKSLEWWAVERSPDAELTRRVRAPRTAGRGGLDRPRVPDLLALLAAPRLRHRRRLDDPRGGDPPADARRERDRGVDAGLLLEAHGRLAAQHGRLEHLAPPLLRAAVAVLPVQLVRQADRDRLTRRAARACDRRAATAAGAASTLDRQGADPVRLRRPGAP